MAPRRGTISREIHSLVLVGFHIWGPAFRDLEICPLSFALFLFLRSPPLLLIRVPHIRDVSLKCYQIHAHCMSFPFGLKQVTSHWQ
jgi:hypothetical protein